MITKGIMAYSPTTLKKINELGFVFEERKTQSDRAIDVPN